jgi:hypothetical protein
VFRTWGIELEDGEIRASVGETAKRGMQSEELGAENRRIRLSENQERVPHPNPGKSPTSSAYILSCAAY